MHSSCGNSEKIAENMSVFLVERTNAAYCHVYAYQRVQALVAFTDMNSFVGFVRSRATSCCGYEKGQLSVQICVAYKSTNSFSSEYESVKYYVACTNTRNFMTFQ